MQPFQTVFQLEPILPYRLDLTLQIVRRFAVPLVDIAGADDTCWRALGSTSGGMTLWCVTPDLRAELMATTGTVTPDELNTARHDLAHILAMDEDPRPFYDFARRDPGLWRVIEPPDGIPLEGVRWLRTPTVFEALVALIIEQHIAWVAAQKSQQALLTWAGNTIEYAGRTFYAYPTPAQLAAATLDDLRELKVTNKRKQLLIDLAGQIASGGLPLEGLRDVPHSEAYHALLKLHGIGHWTAANVVMRALGGFPYVPETDVALQAAANFYFNGASGKLTPKETHVLFQRYGEFAGYAAYHTLLRWVLDRYPMQA